MRIAVAVNNAVKHRSSGESIATLGAKYRAQVDGIADEKQQAENGLLKSLTEEAMKAQELRSCFVLD